MKYVLPINNFRFEKESRIESTPCNIDSPVGCRRKNDDQKKFYRKPNSVWEGLMHCKNKYTTKLYSARNCPSL